jgi:hypothetical protein
MIDPQTIEFALFAIERTSGTDVRLTVPEGNSIVEVAYGQPWPACTNLLLPFP